MKAVILAGGKGTRLMPLTRDLPKPMMPVLNRPLIFYAVRLLRHYGFDDISVTLQHLPTKITDYLTQCDDEGLRFFLENTPLGTAGSVRNAVFGARQTILIISGDALTDINLSAMLSYHHKSGAALTMATAHVNDSSQYGLVKVDGDGRVNAFSEKVAGAGSGLVNCGIYLIEPEVLEQIPPSTFFDFARDLFPLMMKNNQKICAFRGSFYWCDIGDINSYYNANMDMLHKRVRCEPFEGGYAAQNALDAFRIDSQSIAASNAGYRLNSEDFCGSQSTLARLREGSLTTPQAIDCVVGDNVYFSHNALAQGSVIWADTVVERDIIHCVVSNDFCISIPYYNGAATTAGEASANYFGI